jgi:hypothetical protein
MHEPLHTIGWDVAGVVRREQAVIIAFIDTPQAHHAVATLFPETSVTPRGLHLRQGQFEEIRWEPARGRYFPRNIDPRKNVMMEQELGLDTMHPARASVPQVTHKALAGL